MPNRKEVEPHTIEIVSGRNPYQIYLMVLLAISGLSVLLTAPAPASLEKSFPAWALAAWGVTAFIGGTANLFAVLISWHERLTGMYIEIFSCLVLTIAGVMYTYAAIQGHAASTSYIGIGIISVLGIASLWRATQLYIWSIKIREIRKHFKTITTELDDGGV